MGDYPEECCDSCRFFAGKGDEECRRHAPIVTVESSMKPVWPHVHNSAWVYCGDYEKGKYMEE